MSLLQIPLLAAFFFIETEWCLKYSSLSMTIPRWSRRGRMSFAWSRGRFRTQLRDRNFNTGFLRKWDDHHPLKHNTCLISFYLAFCWLKLSVKWNSLVVSRNINFSPNITISHSSLTLINLRDWYIIENTTEAIPIYLSSHIKGSTSQRTAGTAK